MIPRWRCKVLVAAVSALALATSAGASATRLAVQIVGGMPATQVRLEASTPSGSSIVRSLVLREKRRITLRLVSEGHWSLQATAVGFWSPSLSLQQDTSSVTLTLWPAAEIALRIEQPDGLPLPEALDLRLSPPGGGPTPAGQPPEAEIPCPVDEDGSVVCAVPAGRWDIRAKCAGFVPHYFWDAPIAAGERAELGQLALREGVSLLGRVVTEAGAADPQRATVTLQPDVDRDTGSPETPRPLSERLAASSEINEWGYFQFDSVAPGAYRITARQPGFEATSTRVVMSAERDEELSDPIVLLRLLSLGLSVDPPSDLAHEPWHIELLAIRSGNLTTITEGDADEEGRWQSPPVAAGRYTVNVTGRTGNSFAWEEFDLARGAEEHVIDLAMVPVQGEVRIGDEPFAAKLWFGGRSGGVHVAADADSEGQFTLVLPRSGRWVVDIQGIDRNVDVAKWNVTVEPTRENHPAEVVITLPDTVIHGDVRDDSMQPVAGARVTLVPLNRSVGPLAVESDILGDFEIQGQPPGTYMVQATDGGKSSEPLEVILEEDMVPPRLELILAERRRLAGKVISASGPVAGASILGFPINLQGGLGATQTPQARSGMDGSFHLDVPGDTTQVRLVVMALGYALHVSSAQVTEEQDPFLVVLDQAAGRLQIPTPRVAADEQGTPKVPLLMINGQPFDASLLPRWAQAHDAAASTEETLAVDAMPPGAYAYCQLAPEEALLVFSGAAIPAADACSEGHLAAGGVLALTGPR